MYEAEEEEEEEEESDDELCDRTTAPVPKWEVLAGGYNAARARCSETASS
jgi:hypothetical protein